MQKDVVPSDEPIEAPATFDRVFTAELKQIAMSRVARHGEAQAQPKNSLVGLAFSGGGIRSATFNLGILQALAENHLLHKFDYLSTVSGGGYIGSWLAALTKRLTATVPGSTFASVEEALRPASYSEDRRSEPTFLHWLRLYSNYLTPRKGLISGDTWAMVGTWLRNVFLNQVILGLIFIGAFVFCHGVLLWLVQTNDLGKEFLEIGTIFLSLAVISMAINIVDLNAVEPEPNPAEPISHNSGRPGKGRPLNWFQRIRVSATVLTPFVFACVLLNGGVWQGFDSIDFAVWKWAVAGAIFYLVVWGAVALLAWFRRRKKKIQKDSEERMISIWSLLIFSPIAGAAGACLLNAYAIWLNHLPPWTSTNWIVTVFGSGIIMFGLLLTGSLHIGLVGRGSRDLVREWWARLGGYLFLLIAAWLLFAGTCAFGPLLVRWFIFKVSGWKSISAGLLWVANNYFGIKAASSPQTSGAKKAPDKVDSNSPSVSNAHDNSGVSAKAKTWLTSSQALEVIAKIAPYIFAAGLILLFATAVHLGVGWCFDPSDTKNLWRLTNGPTTSNWYVLSNLYWTIEESAGYAYLLWAGLLLAVAGGVVSWRVDVNDFSLHHFYRNRLVRCYLGASNPRRSPQAFTGFDPHDDLPLCHLSGTYPGPFPLLNAALNITSGEELGYATRRAKSFVFSPLFCGYDLRIAGDEKNRFESAGGYVRTFSLTAEARSEEPLASVGSYQGIALGTAMAISGAAVSPNMGYFTSPATAFFMTLFDVRLGWWMGNPRYPKKWQNPGPQLGLAYLFSELVGQSDQNKSYLYLSDGGHFENLAVYELIKRHCKVIVACDADCDGSYEFDNLISLIEKARTDFGARIDVDFARTRPQSGRESEYNFAAGTIYYDPRNQRDRGTFIYLKASMPKKDGPGAHLPDDVWRYFNLHQTFPHQSTAEQWFDELQFESYRALGEYIGNAACDEIRKHVNDALSG